MNFRGLNTKIVKRWEFLVKLIKQYDYEYHELDSPSVSDDDYDILYRELVELETAYPELQNMDSPTKKVVSSSNKTKLFEKVKHEIRMLSLEKCYSRGDILSFVDKLQKFNYDEEKIEFTVEPKYDGLSLNIFYNEGKIIYAVTRGDGQVGENVTENILTISSIPQKIEYLKPLHVRGEIVVKKSEFEIYNKKFNYIFKNPRNFAAGSLRQKDSSEVAKRPLDFIAYELIGKKFNYQEEKLSFLKNLGFIIPEKFEVYSDVNKMIFDCENGFGDIKKDSLYEIDGLVAKVRNTYLHSKLGTTEKCPRWAFAFKFPTEKVKTKILSVEYQIGKTGIYTPVANYEKVNISGSECSRASLHNFDYIRNKDIMIGDSVIVEKSGEIIPQVVKVLKELRTGDERKIIPPETCFFCDSKIKNTKDGAFYYCSNPDCPERKLRLIQFFVGKSGLDIRGFGEAVVEKLFRLGKIDSIESIFSLSDEDFEGIDGFGEKSVKILLDSIKKKAKETQLYELIRSLSVEGVGSVTAKSIAENFKDIDSILHAEYEKLIEIEDIGETIANNLIKYISNESNRKTLLILSNKIKIVNSLFESGFDNFFKRKKIVITGTLNKYKRNQLKDILTKLGARVQSSVSKNTDILICGQKPGSKLKKAQGLGIEIISEEKLVDLLPE